MTRFERDKIATIARLTKRSGYVYVMVHDQHAGVTKIGFSIHPLKRARQVKATVVYSKPTPDMVGLEKAVHNSLKEKRNPNVIPRTTGRGETEWFDVSPEVAIREIEKSFNHYNCPHDEYYVPTWVKGFASYEYISRSKLDVVEFCVHYHKGRICDESDRIKSRWDATAKAVLALRCNWDLEFALRIHERLKKPPFTIAWDYHPQWKLWEVNLQNATQSHNIFLPIRKKRANRVPLRFMGLNSEVTYPKRKSIRLSRELLTD